MCSKIIKSTINIMIIMSCFIGANANESKIKDIESQQEKKVYSQLWGKNGELFDAKDRLPHVALAGYKYGLEPIPYAAVKYNVKDFGAKGDGKTDDSAAFQQALAKSPAGVVYVPEGKYLLKQPLKITQSGTVLRGEGPEKTTFIFPMHGEKVKWGLSERAPKWDWRISAEGGKKKATKAKHSFSYSANYGGKNLAQMVKTSQRGDYSFTVNSAHKIKPGMEIVIGQRTAHRLKAQKNKESELLFEIGGGQVGGPEAEFGLRFEHVALVEKVQGKTVFINKPFRFKTLSSIKQFKPRLKSIGIEDIAFEFPSAPFPHHFGGNAHNGILLNHVAHSWIRNVKMNNVDNGIYIVGLHNTVSDITYNADRQGDLSYAKSLPTFLSERVIGTDDKEPRLHYSSIVNFSKPFAKDKSSMNLRGSKGHHSTTLSLFDNLATRITLNAPFIHEITYNRSIGNVVSEVTSNDMSLDHHRRLPADNVWTNIDAGQGTRFWLGTGRSKEGLRMGKNITLWNVTSNLPQNLFKIWDDNDSPKTKSWKNYSTGFVNIIGVNMNANANHKNAWIEHRLEKNSNTKLHPENIHLAQKDLFRAQHGLATAGMLNKVSGHIEASSKGLSTEFNLVTDNNSAMHYFWKFGDGATSRLAQPHHRYENKGDYKVTLYVTDKLNNERVLNYLIKI